MLFLELDLLLEENEQLKRDIIVRDQKISLLEEELHYFDGIKNALLLSGLHDNPH